MREEYRRFAQEDRREPNIHQQPRQAENNNRYDVPKPQNIYEQELANLQNRKGISVPDVSDKWIKYYDRRDEMQRQMERQRIEIERQQREEERRNIREREHRERMKELTQNLIDINLQNKTNEDAAIEAISKLKEGRQPIKEPEPKKEYIPPVPVLKYSDVKHLITGKISDYDLRDKVVHGEQDKVMVDHKKFMYNQREPLTREEQAEEDENYG